MIEALNATYVGLANGQLILKDGKWEKEGLRRDGGWIPDRRRSRP